MVLLCDLKYLISLLKHFWFQCVKAGSFVIWKKIPWNELSFITRQLNLAEIWAAPKTNNLEKAKVKIAKLGLTWSKSHNNNYLSISVGSKNWFWNLISPKNDDPSVPKWSQKTLWIQLLPKKSNIGIKAKCKWIKI